ncbi:MAG: hypothetical protein ACE365_07095 [Gammaproteobacteria bacterium]
MTDINAQTIQSKNPVVVKQISFVETAYDQHLAKITKLQALLEREEQCLFQCRRKINNLKAMLCE